MDSNNWRPAQTEGPPPIDGGDWRSQLQPDSRSRIVNKIMETLKRHLPFSGQEGLQELRQIAIRFEEKIYSAATSQSDYLRKISLKMLTMESKSQTAPSNATGISRNPQDSVPSQSMQSQLPSQSQSVSLQMASNQAQNRQQLLAQNMQSNNIASSGMQPPANLPNALPSSTLSQNALPNVPQNISGISQNSMGNTMNQGVASNMFSNAPRQQQMQGRQLTQQVGTQQHQQQSQNAQQLMYQQQLMKQKVQQAGNMQPLMQAQLQQQPPPQQNLLQANQQPMMQTSSVMQPSMLPGLPQTQQSLQQPSQSVLQQHQQSAMRQQQQTQQSPIIQQQQTQAQQQSMMSSQAQHSQQQQQPLIGQQPSDANIQQSQLLGQQSNIPDMQQQQRLLGQQSNIQNLPNQQASHQNLQQQQQHMMGQQSNLSNMHQQQLGHQSHVGGLPQQQVMGTQSGSTNMQMNQHSLHMLQQPKAPIPQQGSLLQGGGQQAQTQLQSQQQLMSQLQSQPRQLQQQLGLQQSTNSLQQNMQPRVQNPNSLLQQQNMIDQQNKLLQAQRTHAEAPTTSLDSTAQTGGTNGGDWQEEVYQKIKNMKDMYFADLNDMYQKISIKMQQNESLSQGPKADQLDKLRLFKNMLEKLMQVLQTTKNSILLTHKEKLPSFEKQIISLLSSNRPRRPVPSMQPGQILPPQMQSMQQLHQSHSQISQPQSHEVGVNPQLQSMNLQGSVAPMQQSNVPSLQHGSVPSLSAISSSQQSMAGPGSLQNNSNLESGQGNTPSSMQQVAMTSLQQNPAGAPQPANITSLQSQTDTGMLQPNINSHQSNSNMLQNQIMQNPQFKQQLQNRHLQQQLIHKQFQQQQAKQQQASQIAAHQMPQLHQNDVNEKMRQNLGIRSGTFPQHLSSSQRFAHQQLKSGGASFPVSSPQLLQAVSPQISHHSPQIDQQNLQQSVVKSGTPLQSANSPFVPSPSTPLAPSPMPGDSEKPAVSSLSNAANVGNQQGGVLAATQSLSIGTPGISPSPLFECVGPEGILGNSSAVSGKSSLTEQPLDRLLKAVNSISPKALEAAVCDIRSVVSMIDRIAGSAPGNGSRATVGEDLVALTKCRLQARNFLTQDGNTGTKRMRRYTSAMPLNDVTTVGSMNDSLMQLAVSETSELESTANSNKKRVKTEVNHALLEEIREINERLIDTVVDISDEEMDPFIAASAHEGSEGTIVRCSYSAVSLSPDLKAHYSSSQVSQIQPLRLLVPLNYPNCSPILLDKFPVDVSNEHEDLSAKAKSRFSISLRSLSQPMSLKEIARTWDHCTRAVICDYAQKSGGGTFSSKYGTWEKCSTAA